MLSVDIEWLDYENPENKKLIDTWAGIRDADGHRVVPFSRVIQLVKPEYAIELLSKIYSPKEEAQSVRYELAHRRLASGKFSVLDILNTDQEYYKEQIKTTIEVSAILRKTLNQEGARPNLVLVGTRLRNSDKIFKGKHRFDDCVFKLIEFIASDIPEFGSSAAKTDGSRWRYFSYLEKLYELSFELFVSFQKEATKLQEVNTQRQGGFLNDIRHSSEQHRLAKQLLNFRADMSIHYSAIIKQDLILTTGS